MTKIWQLPAEALLVFRKNDPLRMAGATAFFTTFALPPILIILIQLFGLFLDPGKLSQNIFNSLALTLGNASVRQIRGTLQGFQRLARNGYITIGGFLFLVFVATTLFKVIKDSLNQLWNIRVSSGGRWMARLLPRIRSMLMILLAGILFLAELAFEGTLTLLRSYFNELWSGTGTVFFFMLHQAISLLVVTAWFAVLFKYLPDGTFSWKTTITGALFTGILFTAGKLVLGRLLTLSNIKSIYGASGSFVIVLLFLFYVSLILYYGAAFTAVWAAYRQSPVNPGKHASLYELADYEAGDRS